MNVTPAPENTASAWKAAAVHDATLPSGFKVKVKVPNLTAMAKAGTLPNELLDLVTKDAATGPTDPPPLQEQIDEQYKFNRCLTVLTVVEPKITDGDFDEIPAEDVQMIVQIALRQTDMDAIGHQLGGLETIESFRQFRDLDSSLTDLLGQ